MENNNKLEKVLKTVHCSMFLILALLFFSTSTTNINHAKVINPKEINSLAFPEKELAYTFKVSDKLIGTGEISLSIQEKKLEGVASGIGMTCQCNVNFLTKISGRINESTKKLSVEVDGTGDPVGILIPGKVTFKGPLNGFLSNGKVCLSGKVNIEGSLARYAGFKDKEEILIEIPDPELAKAFKELKNYNNLASL